MRRGAKYRLAALAMLFAAAGCASCGPHGETTCLIPASEPILPPVQRTAIEPGLLDVAAALKSTTPTRDPQCPPLYRVLAPKQCQCLAAQHAPLANSFDRQRQKLHEGAKEPCLCQRKAENQRTFQKSMLLYSALESRDQFAGKALEWYYQLAGAEAKADLLNLSLGRARDTLTRIQHLRQQGIRLPAPMEKFERQIVQLQLQQTQNQLSIGQLNSKLRQALGFAPEHTWRFRPDPTAPLGTETATDVEAAVQLGLAQRPQLLLLRSTIANLDRDTLKSARSLLQTINPLLAMSGPAEHCKIVTIAGKILHIQPGKDDEVERVRAQLIEDLHERERAVAAEIREAIFEVGVRRECVVLAREAAKRWRQRIADLEKQHAQGLPAFADLASAYLEWHKGRGDVVKEFIAWKTAAVKVKQAQGILPAECGYIGEEICGDCAIPSASP